MSDDCRSISDSPFTIHSASALPTPGPSLTHTAAADQRPFTSGVSPSSGRPSGVSESRPLIAYLMPDRLVVQHLRDQLERVLHLLREVVLRERQLGRRERRLLDGRDLLGVVEDRPVGVRADLEPAPVLALVHVRVHVADDRELDHALRVLEVRHRADVDHLVHGRRQRDRRTGHAARSSGSRRRSRRRSRSVSIVAARRAHAGDAAVLDVDPDDLGVREDAAARRAPAPSRARASRSEASRRCRRPACRSRRGSPTRRCTGRAPSPAPA